MKKFLPIPIIFLLFLFSPIAFAHYEHFKIPTATITIDGNSDDWNNIEPTLEDDVDDQDPKADYDGTDLHKLYLAKDDTFLYAMMTFYDGEPYTGTTMVYGLSFKQLTGYNDSVGDRWTYALYYDNSWSVKVVELVDIETLETTDIDGYSSNKYIGVGSNFIEWKVSLSAMGTRDGRFIQVWIYPYNVSGKSGEYLLSDYAGGYTHIVDEDAVGTGIMYGTVTDEEGFPFKNVSVSMTGGNGYSKTTETDEEGYYEFTDLAAGDYTLTYEKDGYQTKTQQVSLEEGETLELEIIVMEQAEKGNISGYVTNIYGDPIESVKLKLKGIITKTTKDASTDADGFFEFADIEADDYMITATKKRYRSARKSITIEEGDVIEVEIEMRKTTKRRSISLLMRGR
jgi:hypothetical protein